MFKKMLSKLKGSDAGSAVPAQNAAPELPDLSAEHLVLRIRNSAFLDALRQRGIPQEQMPHTQPLCGELIVSYAFDTPQQFITATPPLLQEAGIAADEVHELAVHNTQVQIHGLGVRIVPDEGGCLLRVGQQGAITHLEACCLLYPGALELLREELQPQGHMLLCVPTRNYLFALDSARPQSHARTLEFAREMHEEDSVHALSLQWMTHTDDALQLASLD